jgi:hypothetical protein
MEVQTISLITRVRHLFISTFSRVGRVAQVVEHLPSSHDALSSNPVPPKKAHFPF